MATVAALLARAEKHLGKKAGLEALVAAWQQVPAVTLLELADRCEQAHPGPAFTGDTDDFRKQAKSATAAERGGLLKAIVGPKSADTLARLEAVARWEPDPRTSRAIEQLLRDVPYTSDGTRPVWAAVFRILAALKDPRFVPMRQSLVAGWKFRENHRAWMTAALERATEGIPDQVPELEEADEAAARALAARLKAAPKPAADRNEEGLLADVYANPRDDGPRLVYADWLQERGDPRGEFIALQFSKTPDAKREAALLKAHGRRWLGPLEPVVTKDVVFRRGFAAAVTARFRHQKDAEAHGGSPAWATIEEMAWSAGTSGNDQMQWTLFVPPALRARKIATSSHGVAAMLDAQAPWEVEDLTALVYDVDLQRRFASSSLFPNVTRLTVSVHARPELFAGSWMAQVKDVTFEGVQDAIEPWLAGLQATEIERLTLRHWSGGLVFRRGPDGQFSEGALVLDGRANALTAAAYLRRLPDGWLTSLALGAFEKDATLADLREAKLRKAGQPAPRPAARPAIDPKLTRVAAIGWAGDVLHVVAGERLLQLNAAGVRAAEHRLNSASAAAFAPGGQQVAVGVYKKVELRASATGALIEAFAVSGNPKAMQFDATGKVLLVVTDGTMTVHAIPSGKEVRKVSFGTHPKRPISGAFSPDGGTLAASLFNNQVVLYPPDAKRAARAWAHGGYINQVLFVGPDRLATSCRDQLVRIFATGEPEPVVARKIVESPVLLRSPDGTRLLASGGTKTRLLDPVTLTETGAVEPVLGCPAFSPDGRRVAGVVNDRVVVLELP